MALLTLSLYFDLLSEHYSNVYREKYLPSSEFWSFWLN